MEKVKLQFSDRLNEACDSAGVPVWGRQRFLAKKLNLAQPSVSKWFLNKSLPTIDNIAELADLLNVRIEWLVTGRGQKIKNSESTKEFSECVEILATLSPEQQQLVLDFTKMIKNRS